MLFRSVSSSNRNIYIYQLRSKALNLWSVWGWLNLLNWCSFSWWSEPLQPMAAECAACVLGCALNVPWGFPGLFPGESVQLVRTDHKISRGVKHPSYNYHDTPVLELSLSEVNQFELVYFDIAQAACSCNLELLQSINGPVPTGDSWREVQGIVLHVLDDNHVRKL